MKINGCNNLGLFTSQLNIDCFDEIDGYIKSIELKMDSTGEVVLEVKYYELNDSDWILKERGSPKIVTRRYPVKNIDIETSNGQYEKPNGSNVFNSPISYLEIE